MDGLSRNAPAVLKTIVWTIQFAMQSCIFICDVARIAPSAALRRNGKRTKKWFWSSPAPCSDICIGWHTYFYYHRGIPWSLLHWKTDSPPQLSHSATRGPPLLCSWAGDATETVEPQFPSYSAAYVRFTSFVPARFRVRKSKSFNTAVMEATQGLFWFNTWNLIYVYIYIYIFFYIYIYIYMLLKF